MRQIASRQQLRMALLRWALVLVPGIVLLGFLSGQFAGSGPGNPWFDALTKPSLYPPPVVFGIVWTALYVLMAVALALVITARGARGRRPAIAMFVVQLILNLAWTPLFFAAHQIKGALALIVALDLAVIVTIVLFARVRKLAAWLLVPYLAWILFATALTWQFLVANPDEGAGTPVSAVRIAL